jgi:DNA gyrase subunit B
LLGQLGEVATIVQRRGIDFEEFLTLRGNDPEGKGRLPRVRLQVPREGAAAEIAGDHYFWSEHDEAEFVRKHHLRGEDPEFDTVLAPGPAAGEGDTAPPAEGADNGNGNGNGAANGNGHARAGAAIRKELHEVKELERIIARLAEFGLSMDDYALVQEESLSGEKMPTRFELVSKDARGHPQVTPIPNVARIVPTILDVGKHGLEIKRFKGLGEMDADQLWETTMNPANRVLLKVTWDAATQAEQLFSVLMGEEVEPRRKYIEEHALEVKNLDV